MISYTAHDEERLYPEEEKVADDREAFERDRGRIIHSAAFRRLQGKTQVFGVRYGDFFRTRLTHSLEVAQIGKALAVRLGADPTLVEAICLAHDIGHPPFGHYGEQVLRTRMAEHGNFEANAQNLRVLTQLEVKSDRYTGLNLTRSVLDGLLKYKAIHGSRPGLRKSCYAEDAPLLEWVCEHGSLEERSFECQIMNWADDVAYSAHDLEDGIHVGMITVHHLRRPSNQDAVIQRVQEEAEERGSLVVGCRSGAGVRLAGCTHDRVGRPADSAARERRAEGPDLALDQRVRALRPGGTSVGLDGGPIGTLPVRSYGARCTGTAL